MFEVKFLLQRALVPGELIIRFPGTNIHMIFNEGKVYHNEKRDIFAAQLGIRDIKFEFIGEPEGMSGALGRQLAEQLSDPGAKKQIKKLLAKNEHYLFFSQTKSGKEVITLPGVSGKFEIDEESVSNKIRAIYSIGDGKIPSVERIYAHHIEACEDEKLIQVPPIHLNQIDLVKKANEIYDESLKFMKEVGI